MRKIYLIKNSDQDDCEIRFENKDYMLSELMDELVALRDFKRNTLNIKNNFYQDYLDLKDQYNQAINTIEQYQAYFKDREYLTNKV